MLKTNLTTTICNCFINDRISRQEAIENLSRWSKHFSWGLSLGEIKSIEKKAYNLAVAELNNY